MAEAYAFLIEVVYEYSFLTSIDTEQFVLWFIEQRVIASRHGLSCHSSSAGRVSDQVCHGHTKIQILITVKGYEPSFF